MRSKTRKSFWRDYARLPRAVRDKASVAYRLFMQDSMHPSLQFKQVHASLPIWSERITASYRAVGVRTAADVIVWFFIGTHAEYERLLDSL